MAASQRQTRILSHKWTSRAASSRQKSSVTQQLPVAAAGQALGSGETGSLLPTSASDAHVQPWQEKGGFGAMVENRDSQGVVLQRLYAVSDVGNADAMDASGSIWENWLTRNRMYVDQTPNSRSHNCRQCLLQKGGGTVYIIFESCIAKFLIMQQPDEVCIPERTDNRINPSWNRLDKTLLPSALLESPRTRGATCK